MNQDKTQAATPPFVVASGDRAAGRLALSLPTAGSLVAPVTSVASDMAPEQEFETHAESLRRLFHRLNNQLGIVLANAELLEARMIDTATRARAAQVVDSALQAMSTVCELRTKIEPPADGGQTTG